MAKLNRTDPVGSKHLRVGLEWKERSVSVAHIWVVNQPVVQTAVLSRDLVACIAVAGHETIIQTVDDPRIARGAYRKDEGHSYSKVEAGIFYVSVPFSRVDALPSLRIQVTHLADLNVTDRRLDSLIALFDKPPANMRTIHELSLGDLQSHPDWVNVAKDLGLEVEAGHFEIYRDKANQYRWRLRRADGEIMADSGQGYDSREECESDLRWVRQNAGTVPVVSLS